MTKGRNHLWRSLEVHSAAGRLLGAAPKHEQTWKGGGDGDKTVYYRTYIKYKNTDNERQQRIQKQKCFSCLFYLSSFSIKCKYY